MAPLLGLTSSYRQVLPPPADDDADDEDGDDDADCVNDAYLYATPHCKKRHLSRARIPPLQHLAYLEAKAWSDMMRGDESDDGVVVDDNRSLHADCVGVPPLECPVARFLRFPMDETTTTTATTSTTSPSFISSTDKGWRPHRQLYSTYALVGCFFQHCNRLESPYHPSPAGEGRKQSPPLLLKEAKRLSEAPTPLPCTSPYCSSSPPHSSLACRLFSFQEKYLRLVEYCYLCTWKEKSKLLRFAQISPEPTVREWNKSARAAERDASQHLRKYQTAQQGASTKVRSDEGLPQEKRANDSPEVPTPCISDVASKSDGKGSPATTVLRQTTEDATCSNASAPPLKPRLLLHYIQGQAPDPEVKEGALHFSRETQPSPPPAAGREGASQMQSPEAMHVVDPLEDPDIDRGWESVPLRTLLDSFSPRASSGSANSHTRSGRRQMTQPVSSRGSGCTRSATSPQPPPADHLSDWDRHIVIIESSYAASLYKPLAFTSDTSAASASTSRGSLHRRQGEVMLFAATSDGERHPSLGTSTRDISPPDIFSACLLSPLAAAMWAQMRALDRGVSGVKPVGANGGFGERLSSAWWEVSKVKGPLALLPGSLDDRSTYMGDLNWTLSCLLDSIANLRLTPESYRTFVRGDAGVGSLIRNFFLAERIFPEHLGCHPQLLHYAGPASTSLEWREESEELTLRVKELWLAWDLLALRGLQRGTAVLAAMQLPAMSPSEAERHCGAASRDPTSVVSTALLHAPRLSESFFEAQLQSFAFYTSHVLDEVNYKKRGVEAGHPSPGFPHLSLLIQSLLRQQKRAEVLEYLALYTECSPHHAQEALRCGLLPFVCQLLAKQMKASASQTSSTESLSSVKSTLPHLLTLLAIVCFFDSSCCTEAVSSGAFEAILSRANSEVTLRLADLEVESVERSFASNGRIRCNGETSHSDRGGLNRLGDYELSLSFLTLTQCFRAGAVAAGDLSAAAKRSASPPSRSHSSPLPSHGRGGSSASSILKTQQHWEPLLLRFLCRDEAADQAGSLAHHLLESTGLCLLLQLSWRPQSSTHEELLSDRATQTTREAAKDEIPPKGHIDRWREVLANFSPLLNDDRTRTTPPLIRSLAASRLTQIVWDVLALHLGTTIQKTPRCHQPVSSIDQGGEDDASNSTRRPDTPVSASRFARGREDISDGCNMTQTWPVPLCATLPSPSPQQVNPDLPLATCFGSIKSEPAWLSLPHSNPRPSPLLFTPPASHGVELESPLPLLSPVNAGATRGSGSFSPRTPSVSGARGWSNSPPSPPMQFPILSLERSDAENLLSDVLKCLNDLCRAGGLSKQHNSSVSSTGKVNRKEQSWLLREQIRANLWGLSRFAVCQGEENIIGETSRCWCCLLRSILMDEAPELVETKNSEARVMDSGEYQNRQSTITPFQSLRNPSSSSTPHNATLTVTSLTPPSHWPISFLNFGSEILGEERNAPAASSMKSFFPKGSKKHRALPNDEIRDVARSRFSDKNPKRGLPIYASRHDSTNASKRGDDEQHPPHRHYHEGVEELDDGKSKSSLRFQTPHLSLTNNEPPRCSPEPLYPVAPSTSASAFLPPRFPSRLLHHNIVGSVLDALRDTRLYALRGVIVRSSTAPADSQSVFRAKPAHHLHDLTAISSASLHNNRQHQDRHSSTHCFSPLQDSYTPAHLKQPVDDMWTSDASSSSLPWRYSHHPSEDDTDTDANDIDTLYPSPQCNPCSTSTSQRCSNEEDDLLPPHHSHHRPHHHRHHHHHPQHRHHPRHHLQDRHHRSCTEHGDWSREHPPSSPDADSSWVRVFPREVLNIKTEVGEDGGEASVKARCSSSSPSLMATLGQAVRRHCCSVYPDMFSYLLVVRLIV